MHHFGRPTCFGPKLGGHTQAGTAFLVRHESVPRILFSRASHNGLPVPNRLSARTALLIGHSATTCLLLRAMLQKKPRLA
jgi:hypothetical protein